MSVKKINIEKYINELTQLIRESFITVAKEFGLTRNNAPTNPAFISSKSIIKSLSDKNIDYFGFFKYGNLIGCYALENAGKGTYYLEKLAVKPQERHKGIGTILVLDSFKNAKSAGNKKVSIGIIDNQEILKNWYKNLGFVEVRKKNHSHLPFTVCYLEYFV